MDLLGAVNLVLRKIGEIPVTSIDEQYPTLALILPAMDEARVKLLSEGYWFNTYYKHTIRQMPDGQVICPLNTLKFFPEESRHKWVGRRIADTDTGSIYVKEDVTGRIIINIPFDELNEVAQYAVAYTVAHAIYLSDIGNDDICQKLELTRDDYIAQINGDHTVQRKQNSRDRKQVQRWRRSLRT